MNRAHHEARGPDPHGSQQELVGILRASLFELTHFSDTELNALLFSDAANPALQSRRFRTFLVKHFDGRGMPETNIAEFQRLLIGTAREIAKFAKKERERPTFVIAGGDAFLNWLLLPAYGHFRTSLLNHPRDDSRRVHEGVRLPLMSIRRARASQLLNNCTIDFALLRSPVPTGEEQDAANTQPRPRNDLFAHTVDINALVTRVDSGKSRWSWTTWLEEFLRQSYPKASGLAVDKASQANDCLAIELGTYHYFVGTERSVYDKANEKRKGGAIGRHLPIAARLNHVALKRIAQESGKGYRVSRVNVESMLDESDCFPEPKIGIECENFSQALTSARFGGCAAVLPSLVFGLPGITEAIRCVCPLLSGADQRVSLIAKISFLKDNSDAMWIFYYLACAMREVAVGSLSAYNTHLAEVGFPPHE